MYDYKDIRDNIKLNPICFVYKINKKEFKLIINTDGKKDAKDKIYKTKDYNEEYFYIIIIKHITIIGILTVSNIFKYNGLFSSSFLIWGYCSQIIIIIEININ